MGYQRSDNRYGYGDGGRERGYRDEWSGRADWDRNDDDRGFLDRAGDEVRSWFGDDEAERRRERDQRRYEREQGYDRPRGYAADRERYSNEGRYGYAAGSRGNYGASGGDYGRRFDRVDAASTGAAFGAFAASEYRGGARDRGARRAGGHDPHYSEWRDRQIDALDRDYDDYRREHQSKFEQEFGSWRERRQSQRQSLGRVTEHMEVVGSDGEHVGTVDKVRGDRIILAKSDPDAGGHHHSIPCGWIEKVEDKVTIGKTAEEAQRAWRDEETSRALFEREDSGSEGPHILNRSFSGTY